MVIMTFTLSSPSISPTGAAALITTRTGVSTAWEAAPATAGPNMKFFYCLAMLLVCLSSQLFVTNSTHQCLSHNRIVIYQIACDRREVQSLILDRMLSLVPGKQHLEVSRPALFTYTMSLKSKSSTGPQVSEGSE